MFYLIEIQIRTLSKEAKIIIFFSIVNALNGYTLYAKAKRLGPIVHYHLQKWRYTRTPHLLPFYLQIVDKQWQESKKKTLYWGMFNRTLFQSESKYTILNSYRNMSYPKSKDELNSVFFFLWILSTQGSKQTTVETYQPNESLRTNYKKKRLRGVNGHLRIKDSTHDFCQKAYICNLIGLL